MTTELLHATAVAIAVDPDGPLAGALLLGSSGSGKSTLALGLIESCPWRRSALIADDAVLLEARSGRLHARAASLQGTIEARGFGAVHVRFVPEALIIAAFDLQSDPQRLPEPQRRSLCGIALAVRSFRPQSEGPSRLRVILRAILSR